VPILNLQRRLREAGRIRIGQQVATNNGKRRPAKLDRFRLTSSDRAPLDAAAALYGGQVERWADAPVGEQWELITTTNVMPVVVPPEQMAFSQWNELWSGGGCVRRCDGVTEQLTDQSCVCVAEDDMQCKPTTRLSLILSDLPGLGVWRLETHGYYAATELAGTVEICAAAASRGQLLPAVLRLEQRQVKRIDKGKPVTRNFAVPILDIPLRPMNLAGALGGNPAAALEQPAPTAIGDGPDGATASAWRPVELANPTTAEPEGPPDIAAALANPAKPPKRTSRSAPDLPSPGLPPRAPEPERTATPATLSEAQRRYIHTLYSKTGVDDETDRRLCTAGILEHSEPCSHGDLTAAQANIVIDRLKLIEAGKADYILNDQGRPIGTNTAGNGGRNIDSESAS
jgi:hypothetical protein